MKNKENIYKAIIIILLLIIAFGGSYFASELKDTNCKTEAKNNELTNISYSEYKELKNEEGSYIIYVARPTCSFCQKQEPIVKQILNTYDIDINYLNTDNMSSADLNDFINGYDVFDGGENFGTPTFLIVGDEKIKDSIIGYSEQANLIAFFTKYNLIKE